MKKDDKLFQGVVVVLVLSLIAYKKIQELGIDYILSASSKILISFLLTMSALMAIGFIIKRKYFTPKVMVGVKEEPVIQQEEIETEEDEEYDDEEYEEEPEEELEEPEPQPEVKINVNEDIKFHKLSRLNQDEIDYLKNKGFKIRTYFNPFNKKREKYIFKARDFESDHHFLTIHIIADYLNGKTIAENTKTFETVKPDIVFEIKNKKFGVEVETGKILRHAKKQLLNKVELLNKNYDGWFFVVTDRNLVARYRQYGKVFDTRYIKNQLDKFLRNA